MRNIFKYSLALGAAVSVIATGCIKETLPTGSSIDSDQALASPTILESMVSGIHNYAATANWSSSEVHAVYGYPSMCMMREVMCNDMATVDSSRDHYQSFAQDQYMNGVYTNLQLIWLVYTKIVALSNDVIRLAGDPELLRDEAKPYLGAAHAYRALAWLDMARMYEYKECVGTSAPELIGLTIPFLHENMTEDFARNNPRLPKEKIIGYIKESLDIAIKLLDGFDSPTKTVPTKAVAYGLLARTLLWEGDYENAKIAAQNALNAGAFSPLTKEQWTDTATGFNSLQPSWMLAIRLTKEDSVVKTSIVNWTSWMSSETSFGYGGSLGGVYRMADARFYSEIPDTDWRKLSWKAPAGSSLEVPFLPASGSYPGPSKMPDLTSVKFRPGQGNSNEYLTGAAIDFPMMRMEEMKFIIAECDARLDNSAASLIDIVKTRNPQYTTSLTGNSLVREVLFQKRIEFWGEGIMFFDYKRCPDLLQINRGYTGTNHIESARFNINGLAPWFNVCINGYEAEDNKALTDTNNPDPSGTVDAYLWDGK